MRDLAHKWTAAPILEDQRIALSGLDVMRRTALYFALISGAVEEGLNALGCAARPAGATDVAMPPVYALAAARDRVLLVSEHPMVDAEGWRGDAFAVTDMTGAYSAIDLEGPALANILAQGTSLDWQSHTRSAALLFAGMSCLVSRFQHKARARLIVENPLLPYFLRWLGAACPDRDVSR